MSNDRTWTRRAALGLIAGGGGFLAFNTGAATQIHANRGLDLGTEDDEAALLPLKDTSGDASISDSDGEATVYSIRTSDLGWEFTSVGVSEVSATSGDEIGTDNIAVTENGSDAVISCIESGFSGEYEITLDIKADAAVGDVSATMQRTTNQAISIDCPIDYSDQNNYSDNEDGTAKRPGESARGVIVDPENVNRDNRSTTLQSRNDDGGLKVGFTLPTVLSAHKYTLTIDVEKSTADLSAYLVDGDGDMMSCKKSLKKGNNTPTINDNNPRNDSDDTISDNRTDLFLIFEDTSNGNNSSEINSFELSAV